MAQPPHSEIPVASAAPPPAAFGEINKQEKQDTQHTTPLFGQKYTPEGVPIDQEKQNKQYTTPPTFGQKYTPEGVPIAQEKQHTQYTTPPTFGKQYTPEGVPIAQGQPAYYARQGIPGVRAFHVVKQPHRQSRNQDCCATPDWILFGLGWIFGIFWPIGALLPLCRTPKFANPTVKGGWFANCVGTVIFIVVVIVIVTARRKSDDSYHRN
ncbi:hypothetical protein KFL_002270120 [Klebsormidium nitens]|uniref:Uncharacterized protein n=1 Tax=Klebsormidium nitens TaxID=105231 RepID=A0A1Y1IB05_KLENI|nr:hypothetical protein KFL_002270120 [Klebsormidium nitens]|eukprot:GAQ85278.1 hypothetical protein KFL_002270120 [Klebsormidium nitens]